MPSYSNDELRESLAKHAAWVRGDAVYVDEDESWLAGYGERIEAAPERRCATCGVALHWANDAWRGPDGKPSVLRQTGVARDRSPTYALDHEHAPEGE